MGTAAVSAAVDLLVGLLSNAQQISTLIQTAQASGRTTLTAEEWASVIGADNSAEAALVAAIAKAKGASA